MNSVPYSCHVNCSVFNLEKKDVYKYTCPGKVAAIQNKPHLEHESIVELWSDFDWFSPGKQEYRQSSTNVWEIIKLDKREAN